MSDIVDKLLNGASRRWKDMGDNTHAEVVYLAGLENIGQGTGTDREVTLTTYCVKTAFTGALVGQYITALRVLDVSGDNPVQVGQTLWRNDSTNTDLASPPPGGSVEIVGATALTAAQLAAAGLALESTQNGILTRATDIRAGIGQRNEDAATDDTGAWSLIQIEKRSLQNWTTLLSRIPAALIPGLLPVDSLGTPGTPRVQATSGTATGIVLTPTCRRVSMYATAGAWYSIGGTATTSSHFIAEGERLDFDVPASTTISVLQDTAAGSIRVTELA